MNNRRFVMVLGVAAAVLLQADGCLAQSLAGGGVIQGTVKDVAGAAVPRARVTAVHLATGVATATESNGEGFFLTPPLKIGPYRVRVEAPGMKTWESELTLETGRTAAIAPMLAPGQMTETITVTSSVPLVTATEATEASTLDARRIAELPINGRDMNTLLADVTPGVEPITDIAGWVRTGGMLPSANNYVQDGASSNDREQGGSMNVQGLESVAEVRMETSGGSAKYSSPVSVIVTTKSGTNRLRFAVHETARNNAFGVARARQDVNLSGAPYQTPKLIRNEFGGSVGGPVFLPSFGLNGKRFYDGRNRTFFFFSREGLELRQGATKDFRVATEAMRRGDFSGLMDAQGRATAIYDPLTTQTQNVNGRPVAVRLPFVDNRIPAARQSPVSKYVFGITRPPSDITNPLVTTNLRLAFPAPRQPNTSDNPATLRIDHSAGRNDNLFFKANRGARYAEFLGETAQTGAPTLGNEANVRYGVFDGKAAAVNWTHIFSPGFFVETAANRSWMNVTWKTGPEQRNWAGFLGLPNPLGDTGWPGMTALDLSNYVEPDGQRGVASITTNLLQNYSLVKGTHSISFGWNAHLERHEFLPDQDGPPGTAAYNSLATALMSSTQGSTANPSATPQTGSNAANFYLGYATSYTVNMQRDLVRMAQNSYAFYLQDNYRISSRLTLTPGLRWDVNPAFQDRQRAIGAFDIPSHSILLAEPLEYYYRNGATTPAVVGNFEAVDVRFKSAAEAGRSPQLFQNNYFDFGPRVGFAYRLWDGARQAVIRGGYGLYISPTSLRFQLNPFSNMAPFRARFQYNPNDAAQSPDGIPNYLLRSVPTVVAGVNSANVIDLNRPNAVARGINVVALGDMPSMKIHEWNMAMEKQVGAASVFRATYAGKRGVNLDQLTDINPTQTDYVWYLTRGVALPTGAFANVSRRPYDQTAYAQVRIQGKTGYINSATFTAEFQRRFSKGLGFQVFHTVTNVLRLGGGYNRDVGSTPDAFLPGAVPTDPAALNRFLNYRVDDVIPKHRTRWNWNYELPIGKGRRFAGNAARALNALIGGWRISGAGTLAGTWWSLPTNNWGRMGNLEVYRTRYPILDCRGTPVNAARAGDERCIPGYLWFNGYISQRFVESRNAAGLRNGVFGLPADYKPAMEPVNPWPKGGQPGAAGSADWDTNFAYVPLRNGSVQRVATDTGLHPWRNQFRQGPFNWTTDASLLKYFAFSERVRLRLNFDVFNVFNVQGLNAPNAEGIVSLANSYNGPGMFPRQVQVTARLEF